MNREIEFRAWREKSKKMFPVLNMNWVVNSRNETIKKGSVSHVHIRKPCEAFDTYYGDLASDLILMQYTGLKDKSGKKIFEGDICKNTRYTGGSNKEIRYGGYKMYESCDYINLDDYHEYDLFGFHLYSEYWWGINNSNKCVNTSLINDANAKDFEVIGNIYENPELLKND